MCAEMCVKDDAVVLIPAYVWSHADQQAISHFIACCYGVARFIVQNKQATTLWSGSRDVSGVDWIIQ